MANRNILLVGEAEVKENSTIEKNVAPKILNLIISDLQKNELRRIIGKVNYDALIDAVLDNRDNGTPFTDRDKDLIEDYIKPFLIAATVVQFIIMNNYKLTNKGVLTMTDDQASALNSGDLEYLKGYYIVKQAAAKKNLVQFINEEAENSCGGTDEVTNDLGGLYLVDNHYARTTTGKDKYL
jgi:hypothetical protein